MGLWLSIDLALLRRHLELLDQEVVPINALIRQPQVDVNKLADRGEHFIGSGYVAIQRNMVCVCAAYGVEPKVAKLLGPKLGNGRVVDAIWHAANYWKHSEEWWPTKSRNEELKSSAQKTSDGLDQYGDLGAYPCASLLPKLLVGEEFSLIALIPFLEAWTEAVSARNQAL